MSKQGEYAEAVEIECEVLVQKTRLFGAEHETILVSAGSLTVSIWNCGHKAEGE